MILRVTDERLLQKTGGIVQGMSGSPILQDGRIIGAVTHVYLNDAAQGYGMYIEWMLCRSDALEQTAGTPPHRAHMERRFRDENTSPSARCARDSRAVVQASVD